jgi:hypothetical protein
MTLDEFCTKLPGLKLSHSEQALAILWYHDEKRPDIVMSSGQLAKIIRESGIGNPNSTLLGEALKKTGRVIPAGSGFRLKILARTQLREILRPILSASKPEVDQDLGYLPRDAWKDTRGYIEKVCEQLNGCYQFGFYDAASVMMRRLLETLLIEAYEALKRESEIQDGAGNYFMLRDLISRAIGRSPVGLGRDARDSLTKIKEMGDRSAHNRRYNAFRSDLDKVQSGLRGVADELINIAGLRRQVVVAGQASTS